ncbi:MAG TPA: ABC transporter ATP-binding protein [Opitutaceae bacterium]|jgi:ABC-2 type transport system ATP-binding protein
MSSSAVIEIEGLTKTFGSLWHRQRIRAVSDVSLLVERGSVVAFVGPNGAGKTTTIYALLGLLKPDQGSIRLFGNPAGSLEARRRTGFQSEIFYTYGFKTADQALRFYGELSGMPKERIAEAVPRQLARLGLADAASRRVRDFSKGMVQRLGLAQALLHGPELLILDEPTTGLDPEGRKLVADIILEEKARGTTILLSSHILSDVERTCDHVVMLRKGGVAFAQNMARLRADSDAWEIEVLKWTDSARAAVPGAEVQDKANGVSVVRCGNAAKQAVLLKLLQEGAEIGSVRQASSLEDIYMNFTGASSNG